MTVDSCMSLIVVVKIITIVIVDVQAGVTLSKQCAIQSDKLYTLMRFDKHVKYQQI